MSRDDEWISDVDWSKITDKHTEYTLAQAKERLKSSIEASNEMDKKSFFIVAGIIGYIAALIPFVLQSKDITFIMPSCVLIAGFFAALLFIVHSIRATEFYPLGNEPKNTLYPDSLKGDYNNFLHWEIISYQGWIKHNKTLNKRKGVSINLSLLTMLCSIVASFGFYFCLRAGFSFSGTWLCTYC